MKQNSTRLKIKVVPGASRSGLAGWLGEALKVRVSTPPENGKANAAVEALLTQSLGLPTGAVNIVSGRKSPHKLVEIDGMSRQNLLEALEFPAT